MSPSTAKLEAALDLVRRGWPTFQCFQPYGGCCTCWLGEECKNPGKHPVRKGWEEEATNDPQVVRGWWRERPYANVGLACGRAGIVVLDVDVHKGGEEALFELERKHGKRPHTPQSITGSGGTHDLFAAPPDVVIRTATAIGGHVGLDLRAVNGLIIAPGSTHVNGRTYQWEVSSHPDDVPLAPLPAWLIELALKAQERRQAEPISELIPEGTRYAALFSLAGSMRRRGMSARAILAGISVTNEESCRPPLDIAELTRIADAISRYAPADAPLRLDTDSGARRTDSNGDPLAGRVMPAEEVRRWLS